MQLNGNHIPTPGISYAIHEYPVPTNHFHASAVTVDTGPNLAGAVKMAVWAGLPDQKFECVEYGGYLGFICRVAPESSNGAYLGYNTKERLICEAQYQRAWEQMVVNKIQSGGFEWCMRKDDHLAFVWRGNDNANLMILRDFTDTWGFTEWSR